MARLSKEQLRKKSIDDLKIYASEHPKEATRISRELVFASGEILYGTTKDRIKGSIMDFTISIRPNSDMA